MMALQYTAIGAPPEIREVPMPTPGSGEVLLRMTAAGVCHSGPARQYNARSTGDAVVRASRLEPVARVGGCSVRPR